MVGILSVYDGLVEMGFQLYKHHVNAMHAPCFPSSSDLGQQPLDAHAIFAYFLRISSAAAGKNTTAAFHR